LTDSLREDEDYLSQQAKQYYHSACVGATLRLSSLQELHPALLSRICAYYLREQGFKTDYQLLTAAKELVKKGTGSENLPGGCVLTAAKGSLAIRRPEPEIPCFYWKLPIPGTLTVADPATNQLISLEIQIISSKDYELQKKIYKNLLIFAADYDTIIGNLVVRQRLPGDRMALPRRGISKPVRRLFSEAELSMPMRQAAWVAADDAGIVWVQYVGNDSRTVLTEHTERVLLLTADHPEYQTAERKKHSDDGTIY
jgi:tRNA(Ile)-lysidine synthase